MLFSEIIYKSHGLLIILFIAKLRSYRLTQQTILCRYLVSLKNSRKLYKRYVKLLLHLLGGISCFRIEYKGKIRLRHLLILLKAFTP